LIWFDNERTAADSRIGRSFFKWIMMRNILIMLLAALIISCDHKGREREFILTNNLDMDRTETISIACVAFYSLMVSDSTDEIQIMDIESGEVLPDQLIDNNADGKSEELVFQTTLKAKSQKKFKLIVTRRKKKSLPIETQTYARFVPERIDDFAWENDLVAFRTYGPEAQRLVDENQKGGTLSSGIDCWLKRVPYPIIDKWYKKYVDGGTYHKDDGEGYDPYHVGASRGCGGSGVWKNDSLYVSKNFIKYKILANGPIRTIFELTYAPWKVDSASITETKRISIDLGSQLSKFEIQLSSTDTLPNCTIGITLHDKKGEVKVNEQQGWYRYWESVDDSEIGTGVVTDPATVQTSQEYRTTKKDLSHIYIMKKTSSSYTYYAGFAWKKADKVTSSQMWDAYLSNFATRLGSPIEVVFEK
jgi:hypothetical protein